ncbi:hypothetical protein D3C75_593210 [compost metagenome]
MPVIAGLAEVGVREVGDQVSQLVAVDLGAREVFVKHVLELAVLALHSFHGVVDQPTDGAHILGLVLARLVPR